MTTRYTHASDGETDARTMTTTSEQLPYNTPISTHYSWSASMKFSAIMKSALIVAMLFLVGSEAFAQLPVRSQRIQVLGNAGGAITNQATGSVTDYTIEWPLAVPAAWPVNDSGYIRAIKTGAATVQLEWVDGVIPEANGTGGEVAYFQNDHLIVSDPSFTFDATGGVTIGVTGEAGTLNVTNGTGGNTIVLDGANSTATIGTGGSAITLNGGTSLATIGPEITLDGATGVGTFGNTLAGEVRIGDGSTNSITLVSGPQAANHTLQVDAITAVAGTFNIAPATNSADATTTGYLYTSNGDGTAQWVVNPNQYYKSGREAVAPGYTHTVNFVPPYAAPVTAADIVVNVSLLSGNGTIIEVTNVTLGGFTIQSTAPMVATEEIMWSSNANP